MWDRSQVYEETGKLLGFEKIEDNVSEGPQDNLSTAWWCYFFFYFCKDLQKVCKILIDASKHFSP